MEAQKRTDDLAASPQLFESDFLNFLINTECLEAPFDSIASFGVEMHSSEALV